ncbi:MAG TPA: lysine--tRNA ligase [Pyrinomonadaceae bacterium]
MSIPFIEENDQTRARHEHLDQLRELVGNVYPNRFERSHVTQTDEGEDTITSVVREFGRYSLHKPEGGRPAPEELDRANEELNKTNVRISGRIATPPRVMGKAAFVHLSDGKERLQVYVRKADAKAISNHTGAPLEAPEAGWQLFNLLDHGDFIGVEGYLFITKTGELSVHVRQLQFLAKALLPMPDKMHGIADPEIRQRQRYADLIAGSLKIKTDRETQESSTEEETEQSELTPREVFERRSRAIREMRRYLDDHGYIEVETPMLTPLATGAAAKPFKTHHNALDIDLYARIAPELYLKRLLVGGFERVYELNRNFRNEGISARHNPEFTMLEFYTAYKDVNWMMDFCEEMLRVAVVGATGGTRIHFEDTELDFGKTFERLSMKQAIIKYWPSEISKLADKEFDESWLNDPKDVRSLARTFSEIHQATIVPTPSFRDTRPYVAAGLFKEMFQQIRERDREIKADESETANQIAELFEWVAEEKLNAPTFITDFPKAISPLSKASPDNPSVAERFELYIVGMECANGFSELNDPEEQYRRFEEQMQQRERGDEEAMLLDEDYIRALSYGMPPAAGIGIGIDRFVMLLTNRRSIRDVILFPHMRPERKTEKESEEIPEQA